MKLDLKGNALQDVHQVTYLAREYPKLTIRELGQLFELTTFDINAAIWRAQDLGYLVIDEEKGTYTVDTVPDKWEFGEAVEDLINNITYVFNKMAEKQGDLHETELNTWLAGTPTHHQAVALKRLLEERVLATYLVVNVTRMEPSKKGAKRGKTAKDVEDVYTFYTLYANANERWGRKQFADQSRLK